MKKVKDNIKKGRKKKIVPGKENDRITKAKIAAIPNYSPGELPKR